MAEFSVSAADIQYTVTIQRAVVYPPQPQQQILPFLLVADPTPSPFPSSRFLLIADPPPCPSNKPPPLVVDPLPSTPSSRSYPFSQQQIIPLPLVTDPPPVADPPPSPSSRPTPLVLDLPLYPSSRSYLPLSNRSSQFSQQQNLVPYQQTLPFLLPQQHIPIIDNSSLLLVANPQPLVADSLSFIVAESTPLLSSSSRPPLLEADSSFSFVCQQSFSPQQQIIPLLLLFVAESPTPQQQILSFLLVAESPPPHYQQILLSSRFIPFFQQQTHTHPSSRSSPSPSSRSSPFSYKQILPLLLVPPSQLVNYQCQTTGHDLFRYLCQHGHQLVIDQNQTNGNDLSLYALTRAKSCKLSISTGHLLVIDQCQTNGLGLSLYVSMRA